MSDELLSETIRDIDDESENELIFLTDSKTILEAVNKAVKFTLMHDKDSVREALKS